jgi:hypothetical protein
MDGLPGMSCYFNHQLETRNTRFEFQDLKRHMHITLSLSLSLSLAHTHTHLRLGSLANDFEWIATLGKREGRVPKLAYDFCARYQ